MSDVLIKGSVNMAELFGDKERIVKIKMLTLQSLLRKKSYDSFGEKGILKMTELFQ